ncbi:MAG: hypothetical protein V2A73_21395 [Pseudomonadota bacterium]
MTNDLPPEPPPPPRMPLPKPALPMGLHSILYDPDEDSCPSPPPPPAAPLLKPVFPPNQLLSEGALWMRTESVPGAYETTVMGLPEEMKDSPCNHLWYEIDSEGRKMVDLEQYPGRLEFLIDKIRGALARDDHLDVVIMLNEGHYEVRIRF